MKTILTAYRVSDLGRSLEFYEKFGFREIGRVAFADGSILVMLNLVGDGDVVTLELAYDPKIDSVEVGNGFSHIAVQVDKLESTLADLAEKGVAFGELQKPAGDNGPKTSFVHDPDGYRFELVEWPPGHPAEMTRRFRSSRTRPVPRRVSRDRPAPGSNRGQGPMCRFLCVSAKNAGAEEPQIRPGQRGTDSDGRLFRSSASKPAVPL